MKHNQGFVLVSMLIIVQILALLGWYVMVNSLLMLKISGKMLIHHDVFVAAESELRQLEFQFQTITPTCSVPVTTLSDLRERTLEWWESSVSCQNNNGNFNFQYVIEILGKNPCHLLQKDSIAEYIRITLRADQQDMDSPVYLQSTIAKPVLDTTVCADIPQYILAGRQSWKEG